MHIECIINYFDVKKKDEYEREATADLMETNPMNKSIQIGNNKKLRRSGKVDFKLKVIIVNFERSAVGRNFKGRWEEERKK